MTRPTTYAVQDGCHNCRHVWIPPGYGDDDGLVVCLFGVTSDKITAPREALFRAWDDEGRRVDLCGKCGEWLGATQEGGE